MTALLVSQSYGGNAAPRTIFRARYAKDWHPFKLGDKIKPQLSEDKKRLYFVKATDWEQRQNKLPGVYKINAKSMQTAMSNKEVGLVLDAGEYPMLMNAINQKAYINIEGRFKELPKPKSVLEKYVEAGIVKPAPYTSDDPLHNLINAIRAVNENAHLVGLERDLKIDDDYMLSITIK